MCRKDISGWRAHAAMLWGQNWETSPMAAGSRVRLGPCCVISCITRDVPRQVLITLLLLEFQGLFFFEFPHIRVALAVREVRRYTSLIWVHQCTMLPACPVPWSAPTCYPRTRVAVTTMHPNPPSFFSECTCQAEEQERHGGVAPQRNVSLPRDRTHARAQRKEDH